MNKRKQILLGNLIKRMRKNRGLSQQELAKLIHTSPNNISRCERGESEIGWQMYLQLKSFFGFDDEDIELEQKIIEDKLLRQLQGVRK